MTRLPAQPGERIDRSTTVSFTFDGKPAQGYAGDTIVSALYASGRRVFSRSFKYHRPRGELCAAGQSGNSLFQIGNAPGIRGASEPITEGLEVIHQNAWPSLEFDVMRVTDKIGGPFTPVGFYYKTFIKPRKLWPTYEKVLRNAAGLGKLPAKQQHRQWETEYRRRHCDLLVIGGGIAGLTAALTAAEAGADVVVCDEDAEPGGVRLVEGAAGEMRELVQRVRAAGVEILTRAPALGFYDGLVPIWQGDTLHQVRAAQTIVATGALQQPLVFPENDLPGTMLSGGARRLAALYAVRPGSAAVVATVDDRGLSDALALSRVGVEIRAVADLRPESGNDDLAHQLSQTGIPLLSGATVTRAEGKGKVEHVTLGRVDSGGRAVDGGQKFDCDLLCVSAGHAPALSMLLQAGGRADYSHEEAAFVVSELPEGLYAAGSAAGQGEDADQARASGQAAAQTALAASGRGAGAQTVVPARSGRAPIAPPAAISDGKSGKAFVDLDEDVTVKDVRHAVAEGYDSIELAKRYTTVTMGPTQGRFSQMPSVRLIADLTGTDLTTVGMTTARPPWLTVPMGALAGRPFEAGKRSAINGRHKAAGADVRWAGDWLRPYDYGDPQGEAMAVHEACGLIDVSTLGKLIVRGPDAGELLDRLYTGRISTLPEGRTRYGLVCSESGRVTDDGTIARLDDETFYVTTTSGGLAAAESNFSWWLEVWGLDATITDVTQGVGAINLAGPKAREVLSSLTDLDCSPEAFKYLDSKHGDIAGIPCMMLRIGFVGELGYEIHCPGVHAGELWDALMTAGAEHGIRPFGLEPQRILRLQKMHIIVGQDTDSETTPYDAAMAWAVKLDKEQDFIGRWALEQAIDKTGPVKLVGFTTGGELPVEGAAVVRSGKAVGQVTSSRRSPKLGKVIGLATVPPESAEEGSSITISDDSRLIAATVTTTPFYDPEGERLRS